MKYKINAEELPEEIEANSLKDACEKVLEHIAILEDDSCSCGACEECVRGTELFNKVNEVE